MSEQMPPIAILAGGLATRLGSITKSTPKSMIEVAGEPFIAHQLRLLARNGIREVIICTGHLGRKIEDFVGDGTDFGCHVRFSPDGPRLLGTGGALRRSLPFLGACFMVMYGDSYLDTEFAPVWTAFAASSLSGLMTVFRNDGQWDASNVEFVDGVIRRYDKVQRAASMRHIDYGLGILKAEALSFRAADSRFDLAEVYSELIDRGMLMGYEVRDRFYEIGSVAGLAETEGYLRRKARRHVDGATRIEHVGEEQP